MNAQPHVRTQLGASRYRRLDKGSLPTPLAYLTQRGLLKVKPRGEWASVTCPSHKAGDEDHPSLRISMADGHYRCHTCGIRGGDILAFHRAVTGMGFGDAVRDIGGRFE